MADKFQLVSRINLLPWRAERRNALRNEFVSTLVFVAAIAGALWYGVRDYHRQLQEHQNARLDYIQEQIDMLDEQIVELEKLQQEQDRLLARIQAIEKLQSNRALAVRLFDELVTSIPDGLSLTLLEQRGDSVSLAGMAQSNASVSALMRNIEASEWLKDAQLNLIEKKMADLQHEPKVQLSDFNEQLLRDNPDRYVEVSRFELKFKQVLPRTDEEEEGI